MRVIVAVSLLALAGAVFGAAVEQGYHASVGIPLAKRLREAELSSSRIIGGQPSPLGAHPYLVGVVVTVEGGVSVCGSSLLSSTRAITAAHCWYDGWRQASLFTMVLGSEYIFVGGVRVDTDQVEMHEGWDSLRISDDIAIVSFPAVTLTDIIQPIALPSGDLLDSNFVGRQAFTAGYGLTGDDAGIPPNQVQSHVEVSVISNDLCRVRYGTFILDTTLCTSGVGSNGNVGICSSDSGGPLSIDNEGERVLIGVSSFGSGVCERGDPNGFSRVTSYVPWILKRL